MTVLAVVPSRGMRLDFLLEGEGNMNNPEYILGGINITNNYFGLHCYMSKSLLYYYYYCYKTA